MIMSVGDLFSLLFSRWWIKLISLVLAVSLWLFVQGKETLEVSSSLQITLEPPDNLAIAGTSVLEKDVTIRGPRALLEGYKNTPLSATIHPKAKGNRRLRLDRTSLVERGYLDEKWDVRLDLVVHEPYVSFTVEEKISRTLPIKASLQGTPSEGYLIEKILVRPQNITISGAASFLSSLEHITTEPLSVDNLDANVTQEVFLDIPAAVTTKFSEETVHITLQVGREKVNQLFSNVATEVQSSKYRSQMIPNKVSIVLQGRPEVLETVEYEKLKAFVNVDQLKPGTHELELQVHIPQGLTLIETIPEKVSVKLWRGAVPRAKQTKPKKSR